MTVFSLPTIQSNANNFKYKYLTHRYLVGWVGFYSILIILGYL